MIETQDRPLRVAIIGAGASGLYAAGALIKQKEIQASVDIFNSVPAPYGLVRYGVAPDHEKIKAVTKLYDKTLSDPRINYFGNVTFGQNISHTDLTKHYDAIIYAVGASADRNLNIPGENLVGSLSATEFVAWYNSHPSFVNLEPNFDIESVAIIGMGNVAVDVCRILAREPDELASTDIDPEALKLLRQSHIKDIYMIARRGPGQVKFTPKELQELTSLTNVDLIVDSKDLELDPESQASLERDSQTKRNIELLNQIALQQPKGNSRRLHLKFLLSPKEILGEKRVTGLMLEQNKLEENQGYLNAVGTGQFTTLDVGMVLRSVGYRGTVLADVPFDEKKGLIPNQAGRLISPINEIILGEYCTGWIKRGPTGLIGTNKPDAVETVNQLLEDVPKLKSAAQPDRQAVQNLLDTRNIKYFTFTDWQHLDGLEQEQGKLHNRPRVKLSNVEEMYSIIKSLKT